MAKPSSGTIAATSLTTGLVAAWPFWEGTGLPYEIVSNTTASASTGFSWSTGDEGPVGVFDGATTDLTYVDLPEIGPAMSIAVRINISVLQWATIFDRAFNNTVEHISLGMVYSTIPEFRQGGSNQRFNGPALDASTWYSIIVTDGGTITTVPNDSLMYYNGTSQTNSSTDESGLVTPSTNDIHIGNTDVTLRYFDGVIDYIFVWNRVLSSTEVTAINTDPWQIFTAGGESTISNAASLMDF